MAGPRQPQPPPRQRAEASVGTKVAATTAAAATASNAFLMDMMVLPAPTIKINAADFPFVPGAAPAAITFPQREGAPGAGMSGRCRRAPFQHPRSIDDRG